VTLLAGLFMAAAAVAALLAPSWFADAAGFPRHTHFVHDAGAFQLDIGASLLLAVALVARLASSAGSSVRSPPPPARYWSGSSTRRRRW